MLEDDVAFAGFGGEGFDQGAGVVGAVEEGEDGLLDDAEGDVFVARVGGPGASCGGVGAGDFERGGGGRSLRVIWGVNGTVVISAMPIRSILNRASRMRVFWASVTGGVWLMAGVGI